MAFDGVPSENHMIVIMHRQIHTHPVPDRCPPEIDTVPLPMPTEWSTCQQQSHDMLIDVASLGSQVAVLM